MVRIKKFALVLLSIPSFLCAETNTSSFSNNSSVTDGFLNGTKEISKDQAFFLSKEIRSFWEKEAENYVNSQTDMDTAYNFLSRHKHVLKQFIEKKFLDPYSARDAQNKIDLLRLLQLQTVIKAVATKKDKIKELDSEWLRIRRNRCAQLLNMFKELFQSFPVVKKDPPKELLGQVLNASYEKGIGVYKILNSIVGARGASIRSESSDIMDSQAVQAANALKE